MHNKGSERADQVWGRYWHRATADMDPRLPSHVGGELDSTGTVLKCFLLGNAQLIPRIAGTTFAYRVAYIYEISQN